MLSRRGEAESTGYTLPVLHEGKCGPKCKAQCKRKHIWYISFQAMDPVRGVPREKRYKINRPLNLFARRAQARLEMAEFARKLQKGWSPWKKEDPGQPLITMEEALAKWEKSKERQLRHSSPVTYSSMTSLFREWCRREDRLDKYVHVFNRHDAVGYMEYVSEEREVGNTTYNNYLQFMSMLFQWLMEKQYRTDDPFQDFARRKQQRKSRTFLTPEDRREMVDWIEQNDPGLLLPVLWIYHVLIRPGELRRLYVADVDLRHQIVRMKANITKSGIERSPTIPDAMMPMLDVVNVGSYPQGAWLLTKTGYPGEQQIGRNTLHNRWDRMRKALGWPASKQLYSLRDTGIIDLLRAGVDLLAVMQQAGHTEVGTTNEYLKHAFPHGPMEVRTKAVGIKAVPIILRAIGEAVTPAPSTASSSPPTA